MNIDSRTLSTTLVLAAIALAQPAWANTNTFVAVPTNVAAGSYTEDGITVSTNANAMWSWPSAGQFHLDPSGFAGNQATFTFASGLFNLVSVDISYASAGATASFVGYDSSNNALFSQSFSAGSLATLSFAGWSGIDHVVMTDLGSHFSIDNLVMTSAVPESSTLSMLLAGLGALGLQARRQRRRPQA